MTNTNMVALSAPLSNVQQYALLVERFPRLDEDEERDLANRLQRNDDLEAAWRLVTSNLRYVVSIARGYSGYGLPLEDLVQEGSVGLMKAVRRFDPSRGVRLMAYAVYWIRAEIHEFILKNWRIVKLATTKARRKLFYKLRSTKQGLGRLSQDEADEIATALGVGSDDVIDMDARMHQSDQSFDAPVGDADETAWAPADYLGDRRFDPESLVAGEDYVDTAEEVLEEALSTLDERSRDIIESRWFADDDNKPTLQELGQRYGVSAERIRQLEVAGLNRLKRLVAPPLAVG